MWLIGNKDKVFLNEGSVIQQAQEDLSKAFHDEVLTLVVGNGPSQSASFLDAIAKGMKPSTVGWSSAIIRAAGRAGVPEKYISHEKYRSTECNLLAIAQAVFRQVGDKDASRRMLLDELHTEFRRSIKPTVIHKLLVDLSSSRIVTTNYDLQIERAFEELNKPWRALVRNVQDEPEEQLTSIFKMHGTIEPDEKCKKKYSYASSPNWDDDLERSVVISETDYDECLDELMRTPGSPLLRALRQPCLIIGKSVPWQDLSFLYALRTTYDVRSKTHKYILCTSLTKEEELNLRNLQIVPLRINMPSTPEAGHYFVGVAKALIHLFPEVGDIYQDQIDDFARKYDLIRAPHFVALGLSAHNTTGRLAYAGAGGESSQPYELPKEGRRNLRYMADEHAGGAALMTLGVFDALDWQNAFFRSMISVTGKREKDIFSETVFKFCKSHGIDVDGVADTASNTWRSIVLIHDSKTHTGVQYPGQRVFLDQGFKDKLTFDPQTVEQLKAQLDPGQQNLRLVYFDKYLALPYPYNPEDKDAKGLLMEHRDVLRNLASKRQDVDILYETGGGGSLGLVVEREFGHYVNILTTAFPFFDRNVLPPEWRKLGTGMESFNKAQWWQTEFKDETQAIEELLTQVGVTPGGDSPKWFTAPDEWIKGGRKWAARAHIRRWMVVTLHHFGALAVDLNSGRCIYTPARHFSDIQNTSGAGDTFRGAFCYQLLRCIANHDHPGDEMNNSMQCCTQFAVRMATEKCRKFKLSDGLKRLRELSKAED